MTHFELPETNIISRLKLGRGRTPRRTTVPPMKVPLLSTLTPKIVGNADQP
jgi:hypothetical protein